ncbi:MAG TPA: hypothetical protein VGK33_04440 [Chloroflexota bacterium]|jgi:predicted transcriptional regulator
MTKVQEKNRRTAAAAAQRKKDAGLKQATFWLTPEATARLSTLAARHDVTRETILLRAILAFPMPALRYGQRVVWRSPSRAGVERRGVVRQIDIDPAHRGEVEILFDDADNPDERAWRRVKDCEPE